jgi:nanoRNase/pAp phosphatase (c-di-AMP/oligoRNAs hydrolase)
MDDQLDRYIKEYDSFIYLLKDKKEFLIIIHNNPDPDALASAFALSYLAQKLNNINTSIAYGGNIGRTENRIMVSQLAIKLKQIGKIKYSKYDLIAMVDTQPNAGNNSFTNENKCHIVIDHHSKRRDTKADLLLIDTGIGATASILVSWLEYSNFIIPVNIATALTYAISSETQNLYREASPFDIAAYLFIYPKASIKKLARILNPGLSRDYYIHLVHALNNAFYYRNIIVSHLYEVPSAEFAAEMADFFIRHRNISWCLCTGYNKDLLYLSVRSTRKNARAGMIIKRLVKDTNNVGGHDHIAGGFLRIKNKNKNEIAELCTKLSRSFVIHICSLSDENEIEWKPLIDHAGNGK